MVNDTTMIAELPCWDSPWALVVLGRIRIWIWKLYGRGALGSNKELGDLLVTVVLKE